jgi:hypothetical protein
MAAFEPERAESRRQLSLPYIPSICSLAGDEDGARSVIRFLPALMLRKLRDKLGNDMPQTLGVLLARDVRGDPACAKSPTCTRMILRWPCSCATLTAL